MISRTTMSVKMNRRSIMVAGGAALVMVTAPDCGAQSSASLEQRAHRQRLRAMSEELDARTHGVPPNRWSPETRKLADQYRAEAAKHPFVPPDTSKVTGPGTMVVSPKGSKP